MNKKRTDRPADSASNGPATQQPTSRRRFLQASGAVGVAMTGGLAARQSLATDTFAPAANSGGCTFSALPTDFIYLNSGTEGSMPGCVTAELQKRLAQWASDPTTSYETDEALGKRQEKSRSEVARFLGVGANNICLTDNTTMGLSMTLMGLDFRPGDRVITTNHEHNAIRSPLQILEARLGLQVVERSFPSAGTLGNIDANELIESLLPDTDRLRGAKALCISHVYPTTGVRLPLCTLRRRADELDIQYLVVDGAQALGMIDLRSDADNIAHCDFYAGPGHKWLNGPPSSGVLFLRNENIRPPEFYPTISQRMGRYVTPGDKSETDYPMAMALQVRGCSNTPGFSAMLRAMDFAERAGGANYIEKHILRLSHNVKTMLLNRSPRSLVSPHDDARLCSGLTAFFPFRWDRPQEILTDRETADWVVSELLKKRIQVRSIGFDNSGLSTVPVEPVYAVRVSTAFFNSTEHVDRFARELRSVLMRI